MRTNHLEWSDLVRWMESGEGANSELESHLLTCRRCARQAVEVRRLLSTLNDARLPSPPPELVERTVRRVRREATAAAGASAEPESVGPVHGLPGPLRSLREVWAVLVGDSLRPSPALRGGGPEPSRVMVFETDEYSIALSIEKISTGAPTGVRGQVVPRGDRPLPPHGCVRAMLREHEISTDVSEFGEFLLEETSTSSIEGIDLVLGESLIRIQIPAV